MANTPLQKSDGFRKKWLKIALVWHLGGKKAMLDVYANYASLRKATAESLGKQPKQAKTAAAAIPAKTKTKKATTTAIKKKENDDDDDDTADEETTNKRTEKDDETDDDSSKKSDSDDESDSSGSSDTDEDALVATYEAKYKGLPHKLETLATCASKYATDRLLKTTAYKKYLQNGGITAKDA